MDITNTKCLNREVQKPMISGPSNFPNDLKTNVVSRKASPKSE